MNVKNKSEIALFGATALAFLFFFESSRELIGATYNMNLATMSLNASVVAVFAFFSPLLCIGLGKFNTHTLIVSSGGALAVVRVAMAVNPSTSIYLLLTVLAVIAFGIFLPAVILQFRAQYTETGLLAPLGLVSAVTAGAGADLVFRALGDTFDITVYGVSAQRLTALAVVLPLVAAFAVTLRLWHSTATSRKEPASHGEKPKFKALFGFGLGALFFLYTVLLGYPNNVARWVDGSYPMAAILYGAAFGVIALVLLTSAKKWFTTTAALVAGSIITVVTVVLLAGFSLPVVTIVLSAVTLMGFPVLLGAACSYLMQPGISLKQIGLFLTAAAVTFVILLLLSVFSLTWAFVPGMGFLRDQMGTILIAAVVLLLAGVALYRYCSGSGALVPPGGDERGRRFCAIFGIFVLAGMCLGATLYQSHPVPAEDSLTVMTYNIHQGYNTAGKINPWEILKPISDVDPDIVALQESDMNRLSGTNADIVQWLAHKLDMYSYFGPETKYQIYGVAILSKYPLANTETYFLESIEDQRVLVRADIQWEGTPLSIYAVHMGLSEEDRTAQTYEIVEILQQNANPKLLMGDLNSLPNSKQIIRFVTVLKDAWTCASNSVMDPRGYTSTSLEPQKRIDYILVSQEFADRISGCEVIRGVFGSDHLPVWTVIEMT
jgi:endonuclease/exonuclease/phosphatase family metal-dependent hydrolase